jgi:hypothetical protein
MLPTLAGFAVKALLPSGKKIDKDKLLNKKESSAIQKVGNDGGDVKTPTIKRKTISTNLLIPQQEIKELPPATNIKKSLSSGKLDDIFDRVGETLQGIIESLKSRENKTKENEEIKQKDAKIEENKEKEEKLERKERFKTPKINIKAPQDKFNLMRFFGNVLLGSIAVAIFNNLDEIISTIRNVFDQIKAFIDKVGEFISPIWDGLKWIVGGGSEIIAKIMGIPSQEADTNGVKKNLEEITKKIPIIGDLFKGIQNTIDSIRGYKEPNNNGGGGGGGDGYVPPAIGAKAGAYDIASRIGANKQQWDTFRNTIAQIESGGSYTKYGGSGNHYDGRYQMGAAAKQDAARILGIAYPGHSDDPNDPRRVAFRSNPELQERMFAAYTLANHGYLSSDSNYQAKQTVEQKLQVLGYAHNQGAGGASKWMRTGKVGKDGFGTSGTKYSNALRQAFKGSTPTTQAPAQIPSTKPSSPSPKPQQSIAKTPPPTPILPSPEQTTTIKPAQVAPTQPTPPIAKSVPQITQQADYEVPYQEPKSSILPIPIGGQGSSQPNMVGGSSIVPISMPKKEALNNYYQAQLMGFLYKQG